MCPVAEEQSKLIYHSWSRTIHILSFVDIVMLFLPYSACDCCPCLMVCMRHDSHSRLWSNLTFDSTTLFSIPLCLGLWKTTSLFGDLLCHWSRLFPVVASQQLPCHNTSLLETFGALQVLKSAYHQGHISAVTQADHAVPRAHSPIVFD